MKKQGGMKVSWVGEGNGDMQQQSQVVRGICYQGESIRRRLQLRSSDDGATSTKLKL